MLALLVAVVVGACIFALITSLMMERASNHSALWSMGFAAVLVTVAAALLALAAIIATRLVVSS